MEKLNKEDLMGNLFGETTNNEQIQNIIDKGTKLERIRVDQVNDYHDHTYIVDEKTESFIRLRASVKSTKGAALDPIVVRISEKYGNPYEAIEGHRRVLSHRLEKIEYIWAIIVVMDDDEAKSWMVRSNIHRDGDEISLREKVRSYKALYESEKQQGKKRDDGKRTDEVIAEDIGMSRSSLQRYLKLDKLSDDMLNIVETKNIKKDVAEILADISRSDQKILIKYINEKEAPLRINKDQADELVVFSKDNSFNPENIEEVLHTDKKKKIEKFTLSEKDIVEWFPREYTGTVQDKKDLIKELLRNHFASA